MTHAQALRSDMRFNLVTAVDVNQDLRANFTNKFGMPSFSSIDCVPKNIAPELVVIATSTPTHGVLVEQVLERFRPSVILCEKPLSYNLRDALKMQAACEKLGVKLLVNFIRRSGPVADHFRRLIGKASLKEGFTGTCWYSKGVFNTATHFLDLLQDFFGAPTAIDPICSKVRRLGDDYTLDFRAVFGNGSIDFKHVATPDVFYNSVEILMDHLLLRILPNGDGNVGRFELCPDLQDRFRLSDSFDLISGDMNFYQKQAYSEVYNYLKGTPATVTTSQEAIEVLALLSNLVSKQEFVDA